MAIIICKSCQQSRQHYGRGVCHRCYQRLFRIEYFQAYRSRPAYREQRLVYDIRYTLKEKKEERKSEIILTFD